jgi:O-antigen biosynthesis protein WbqV
MLKEAFPKVAHHTIIGDIRDKSALHAAFLETKPDIVFHAAALKHVPIVEENIIEGVLTNVFGTQNVADACLASNVQKMVLISTDKAVHPSSLMGVTKRIAEYYVQSLGAANPDAKTDFATVRFGNVLGSSGSVIPLFQNQIAQGGPITITHPDMTRYFMTVPEAVELVLQASTLSSSESGQKSPIFVLDMGQPISIKSLAEQMIRLSGQKDISITYTGIRKGEKVYEELFYDHETQLPTTNRDIQQASAKVHDFAAITKQLTKLHSDCNKRSRDAVISLLKKMVPEYEKHTTESGEATNDTGN